jgi:hypothetical protein
MRVDAQRDQEQLLALEAIAQLLKNNAPGACPEDIIAAAVSIPRNAQAETALQRSITTSAFANRSR